MHLFISAIDVTPEWLNAWGAHIDGTECQWFNAKKTEIYRKSLTFQSSWYVWCTKAQFECIEREYHKWLMYIDSERGPADLSLIQHIMGVKA